MVQLPEGKLASFKRAAHQNACYKGIINDNKSQHLLNKLKMFTSVVLVNKEENIRMCLFLPDVYCVLLCKYVTNRIQGVLSIIESVRGKHITSTWQQTSQIADVAHLFYGCLIYR